MVVVTVDGAAIALIVRPGDVGHGAPTIGDLIVVDHLADAVHIAAAADLIPRVIRQAVAIGVLRHHHDASLVHAAEDQVSHFLIGIAPDGKVTLAGDIGDGMVEVEGDIASPSAQGHEMGVDGAEPCQPFITLTDHVGLRIASLILWCIVDVLSGCRTVFIHRLDILRVLLRPCGAE